MVRRRKPDPPRIHRGRIVRKGASSGGCWWSYQCVECDFGAGYRGDGNVSGVTFPWLVKIATDHADPQHWSRNRGK